MVQDYNPKLQQGNNYCQFQIVKLISNYISKLIIMRKIYLLSLSIPIWCGLTGLHLHAFAQNAPLSTSVALTSEKECYTQL